jgi:hypothetical protein
MVFVQDPHSQAQYPSHKKTCPLSHSHSELILLQCCCCSNPHTALTGMQRWLQDMHSGACQAVEP